MASVYKVLGQVNPNVTTLTDVYTVPANTSTVVSTIAICNTNVTGQYRIAIRPSGAAINVKHYIVYDGYLNAGESVFLTIGATLAATDVVSVYANTGYFVFNVFGSEIS